MARRVAIIMTARAGRAVAIQAVEQVQMEAVGQEELEIISALAVQEEQELNGTVFTVPEVVAEVEVPDIIMVKMEVLEEGMVPAVEERVETMNMPRLP